MIVASLVTVASVVLGAVLGLFGPGGAGALSRLRALALGSAVAVVFGQLLPEAAGQLGPVAIVAAAVGFAGPVLLEQLHLAKRLGARSHDRALGLELGFVGLVVHQLGDGLGMGTFTGDAHEGHEHVEIYLTVAAHTVPIVAVVAASFARAAGRRAALVRAAILAAAAVLGVALTGSSFASRFAQHTPLVSAVVAGLLLHVVMHGLERADHERPVERAGSLALAVLGAAVVLASGHEHGHDGGASVLEAFHDAALAHARLLAWPLAVGLLIGWVLEGMRRDPSEGRSPTEGVVVAAVLLGPAWGAAVAAGWALAGFVQPPAAAPPPHPDATLWRIRADRFVDRAIATVPNAALGVMLGATLEIARVDVAFDRWGSLAVAVGLAVVGGRGALGAVPLALVAVRYGAEVPLLVGGLAAGASLEAARDALGRRDGRGALGAFLAAVATLGLGFVVAQALVVRWSPWMGAPAAHAAEVVVALLVLGAVVALVRGLSALLPAWALHAHDELDAVGAHDHAHDHAHAGHAHGDEERADAAQGEGEPADAERGDAEPDGAAAPDDPPAKRDGDAD